MSILSFWNNDFPLWCSLSLCVLNDLSGRGWVKQIGIKDMTMQRSRALLPLWPIVPFIRLLAGTSHITVLKDTSKRAPLQWYHFSLNPSFRQWIVKEAINAIRFWNVAKNTDNKWYSYSDVWNTTQNRPKINFATLL